MQHQKSAAVYGTSYVLKQLSYVQNSQYTSNISFSPGFLHFLSQPLIRIVSGYGALQVPN